MPWEKEDTIKTALSWGELAPLPDSAYDISVEKQGSVSTREYIVEFYCEQKEIDKWIKLSNGLHNLEPSTVENGIIEYHVRGQVGTISGTVSIDKKKGRVVIDMKM